MDRTLHDLVWQRAHRRCEYCGFPAEWAYQPFQVDHIIAESHRGQTVADNLALACFDCNTYKGPNLAGIDPETGEVTRLYHPRRDRWRTHFSWEGPVLMGKTPVGRATIDVLRINHPDAVNVRRLLLVLGELLEPQAE
jgi:ribosomal protein L32